MRIGIVGSGNIVQGCLDALAQTDENYCEAICVREKSRDKAEAYQKQYGIRTIYTEYSLLLEDSDIEFIYLGIPNHLHFSYAQQALLAGKHVICEKPFTSDYAQAKQLVTLAKARQLFLFEAITTLYAPNIIQLKQCLNQIGAIKLVQSNYSQFSSRYLDYLSGQVHPVFEPKMAGGVLYDINIYNVHLSCFLFGPPRHIQYSCNQGFNGVDTSGVLVMHYPEFISVCCGAKDSASPNQTIIQGEKGYLRLASSPNFAESVELVMGDHVQTWDLRQYNHPMVEEMRAFHRMFDRQELAKCYRYLDHTLTVMQVLTTAREQIGIPFE